MTSVQDVMDYVYIDDIKTVVEEEVEQLLEEPSMNKAYVQEAFRDSLVGLMIAEEAWRFLNKVQQEEVIDAVKVRSEEWYLEQVGEEY